MSKLARSNYLSENESSIDEFASEYAESHLGKLCGYKLDPNNKVIARLLEFLKDKSTIAEVPID